LHRNILVYFIISCIIEQGTELANEHFINHFSNLSEIRKFFVFKKTPAAIAVGVLVFKTSFNTL